MESETLKKLRAKEAALKERIKREQNRENERRKKEDTRRKILAGAAVLDEAEKHAAYKTALLKLLDSFLIRPDERKLFGLQPLPETAEGKKQGLRNGLVSLEASKQKEPAGQ